MDEKLVRLLRVVAEAIVEVVIEDGRARAKRHLTAEVRKEVKLVVVVLLRDGRGAWSTIQWIRLLNWHIPPPMASPVCALAMTIPVR